MSHEALWVVGYVNEDGHWSEETAFSDVLRVPPINIEQLMRVPSIQCNATATEVVK